MTRTSVQNHKGGNADRQKGRRIEQRGVRGSGWAKKAGCSCRTAMEWIFIEVFLKRCRLDVTTSRP
jgi:hypothetical protein